MTVRKVNGVPSVLARIRPCDVSLMSFLRVQENTFLANVTQCSMLIELFYWHHFCRRLDRCNLLLSTSTIQRRPLISRLRQRKRNSLIYVKSHRQVRIRSKCALTRRWDWQRSRWLHHNACGCGKWQKRASFLIKPSSRTSTGVEITPVARQLCCRQQFEVAKWEKVYDAALGCEKNRAVSCRKPVNIPAKSLVGGDNDFSTKKEEGINGQQNKLLRQFESCIAYAACVLHDTHFLWCPHPLACLFELRNQLFSRVLLAPMYVTYKSYTYASTGGYFKLATCV